MIDYCKANEIFGPGSSIIISTVVGSFRARRKALKDGDLVAASFHYSFMRGQVDILFSIDSPLAPWANRLSYFSLLR